ncbi:MAG TPA: MqnA/MqnD/SBP family protein [Gaiellaceae bacterium]|nr:MqnA/MqnD/SBP family protein [Gaiellaceae bacterium]
MLIRLGHSPDPDDAFMFWGLDAVNTREFEFEHVVADLETLNEWAFEGRLEVTAISLHAYAFVHDRYVILPHGARMVSGSGPLVVAREPLSADALRDAEIVVPGRLTTAFLVLRLFLGRDFRYREAPSDAVVGEVLAGRGDAGLVIRAGQLTYRAAGLKRVVDLGEWWLLETGLPLPLGINVARRDLGQRALVDLSRVIGESIAAGLRDPSRVLAYAEDRGHAGDAELADRVVRMYVRERFEDYGEEGREAVRQFLARAERAGVHDRVRVEFVS